MAVGEKVGVTVDFRCVLRVGCGLSDLRNYLFEDSIFEERHKISKSAGIVSGRYQRLDDNSLIVVKTICLSNLVGDRVIEKRIEDLINLHHLCIAAPIGFVFQTNSREMKVVRLYSECCSLREVIAASPAWWTPTVKAKAIAGLVLGLRFAHSFGLIHGRLTANNIVFDWDHHIQITDFFGGLTKQDLCGFSREEWSLYPDMREFASLLFEIVFSRCENEEEAIPEFVSDIIKAGSSPEMERLPSFHDVFATLKQHQFKIMAGVDSTEVLAFIDWVEFWEESGECRVLGIDYSNPTEKALIQAIERHYSRPPMAPFY
jgi:hypothetical protein